jgi:type II secretory pathway pseudopilin PulG
LIELLVVIAVIGVLAAGAIVFIDPAEQLARGRDTQRRSAIKQLGEAMDAYALDNGGYISNGVGGTWQTVLKNGGYLTKEITLPASRITCTNSQQGNVCKYTWTASVTSLEAIVESKSETRRAGGVCATDPVTNYAAVMWLSNTEKTGLRCMGVSVNSWGQSDALQ